MFLSGLRSRFPLPEVSGPRESNDDFLPRTGSVKIVTYKRPLVFRRCWGSHFNHLSSKSLPRSGGMDRADVPPTRLWVWVVHPAKDLNQNTPTKPRSAGPRILSSPTLPLTLDGPDPHEWTDSVPACVVEGGLRVGPST